MSHSNQIPVKHIFMTDDDEDDRVIFAEALLRVDPAIQLTQFENGKTFMDLICIPPDPLPDMVFLDINMPVLNGFECLEKIRNRNGQVKDIQIIVFTTSSDPLDIQKAKELGANFYAVKPNSLEGFISLISRAVHNRTNDTSATKSTFVIS